MDGNRFDSLAKALATGGTRRSLIKGLLGLSGAAVITSVSEIETNARRRGGTNTPPTSTTPVPTTTTATPCDAPCGLDCCETAEQCCDGECCPTGYDCLTQHFPEGPYVEEETCCRSDLVCGPDVTKCCTDGQVCCNDGCCDTFCAIDDTDGNCCTENHPSYCAGICCNQDEICNGDACCAPLTCATYPGLCDEDDCACGEMDNTCGGSIFCECPSGQECCNGSCYKQAFEHCCGGQILPSSMECCDGTTEYDPQYHECCSDGSIADIGACPSPTTTTTTTAVACPPGREPDGNNGCQPCQPGNSSFDGLACLPCPANTFASTEGSDICDLCECFTLCDPVSGICPTTAPPCSQQGIGCAATSQCCPGLVCNSISNTCTQCGHDEFTECGNDADCCSEYFCDIGIGSPPYYCLAE